MILLGAPTEESVAAEKIRIAKEALVSKENMADDSLGDEEWSVISASRYAILFLYITFCLDKLRTSTKDFKEI